MFNSVGVTVLSVWGAWPPKCFWYNDRNW